MPRSATGRIEVVPGLARGEPAGGRVPGYTLVEILVVVLIAGIMAAVVLLRLPPAGETERLERELARLEARLEAMCDQALLTGSAHGIRFDESGYGFFRLAPEGWEPVIAGTLAGTETWSAGRAPRIVVAGRRPDAAGGPGPQVVCTGIEPPTPFELRYGTGREAVGFAWPE